MQRYTAGKSLGTLCIPPACAILEPVTVRVTLPGSHAGAPQTHKADDSNTAEQQDNMSRLIYGGCITCLGPLPPI